MMRPGPRRPPSAQKNGRGTPRSSPRLSPARRQSPACQTPPVGEDAAALGNEQRGRRVEAVVRVRPRWPGRESANACAYVANDCIIEPNPAARRQMIGSRATSVGTHPLPTPRPCPPALCRRSR